MSWGNIWIGLAGGAGGSAAVGASYYAAQLFNMGREDQPLDVVIFGRRLGLSLQAESATAFCLMTGVPTRDRFDRMESSGVDWGLGAGFDVASTVRTGSEALNLLLRLARIALSNDGLASWAIQEGVKNLIRTIMGDISLSSQQPNFVLLPTPASLSIGAGLWYEWSDVLKMGHTLIWRREPPKWKLISRNGSIFLRMKHIPMSDGALIDIALPVDVFGCDDLLAWDDRGFRRTRITGTVYGQKLFPGMTTPAQSVGGQDGINISALNISGRTTVNLLSTGRSEEVARNSDLGLGVAVMSGVLELWSSNEYCTVASDSMGRLVRRIGPDTWRD